jgi:hypothetical protein
MLIKSDHIKSLKPLKQFCTLIHSQVLCSLYTYTFMVIGFIRKSIWLSRHSNSSPSLKGFLSYLSYGSWIKKYVDCIIVVKRSFFGTNGSIILLSYCCNCKNCKILCDFGFIFIPWIPIFIVFAGSIKQQTFCAQRHA